jgi:hypothetical protein
MQGRTSKASLCPADGPILNVSTGERKKRVDLRVPKKKGGEYIYPYFIHPCSDMRSQMMRRSVVKNTKFGCSITEP